VEHETWNGCLRASDRSWPVDRGSTAQSHGPALIWAILALLGVSRADPAVGRAPNLVGVGFTFGIIGTCRRRKVRSGPSRDELVLLGPDGSALFRHRRVRMALGGRLGDEPTGDRAAMVRAGAVVTPTLHNGRARIPRGCAFGDVLAGARTASAST